MRGGFLLGAVIGAAATTYVLTRRNNQINMARMGSMVTSAIGDGFKTMTSTSKSGDKPSSSNQATSKESQSSSKEQLEQMIAKDASVQKEVNEILSKSH